MGYFLEEVKEQGRALRAVAEAYRDPGDGLLREAARLVAGRPLVFTGMGSSWAVALAAEAYLVREGRLAVAVDAGEALYRWLAVFGGSDGLFPVLISQSGESRELVKLAAAIDSPFIAITNAPQSPLGRKAAIALPIHAGGEKGVTNKSFTNSIAVALLLGRSLLWHGVLERGLGVQSLLEVADILEAAAAVEGLLAGAGEPVERLYRHLIDRGEGEAPSPLAASLRGWDLIGRGSGLAAVQQGALVLRELTGRVVTPFTGGLYRHGPVYRSGPFTRALILASHDEEGPLQVRLAEDIVQRGGTVAFLSDFDPRLEHKNFLCLPLPPVARGLFPIPALIPLELLGITDAAKRGFEPGVGVPKVTPSE